MTKHDDLPPVQHTASGATTRWYPGVRTDVVAVLWPAMGIPAEKYARVAQLMSAAGPSVVLADYRGQRSSKVPIAPRARWGYRDLAAGDIAEVVAQVRNRVPGARIVFVCHSLGGQLAAALETEAPGRFDALALIAAGTPHWRAFRGPGRWKPLVVPTALATVARLIGTFDGRRFGFGRQSPGLVTDWARMARTGSWQRGGHVLTPRPFPLLAVSFVGDALAPESAVHALAGQFAGASLCERRLAEPAGHVGWLRRPEAVVAAVTEWLAASVTT